MEIGKLPMAIVGITIAVIVCAVVLIPVVQESTQAYDTFTNDGFFHANYLNTESTDVMTWDHTNPSVITINNVDIDTSTWDSSYNNVTLAFSNKWFIRFALDTTVIYLYDVDTVPSSATSYASPTNEKDFSMVCASGTATITIGTDEFVETIANDGLIIASETTAPYVMKKSTTNAYVLGDSLVYGSGRTDRALGVASTSVNMMAKADVDDGCTLIGLSPNTYTVTTTEVTYTTVDNGHDDLYQLKNFKIGLTDGVNSGTVTYNQIFVPSSVTAERSVHPDQTTTQLINVIPILVIIGIVMLAVGTMIYYRR